MNDVCGSSDTNNRPPNKAGSFFTMEPITTQERTLKRIELRIDNTMPMEWAVGERLFKIILFGSRYSIDDTDLFEYYRRHYIVPEGEDAERCIVEPIHTIAGLANGINIALGEGPRGADGFAFCDIERARQWTGYKDEEQARSEAKRILAQEVEIVNHYLNGDIFDMQVVAIYECPCCHGEVEEDMDIRETLIINRFLPRALEETETARILRDQFGVEDLERAIDEKQVVVKQWDDYSKRWREIEI